MNTAARCILKALVCLPLLCSLPPTLGSPLLLSPLRPARMSNALLPQAQDPEPELYKADWVQLTEAPPRLLQAEVGERLELECEAVGSQPNIEWLRGGEQVTENESYDSNAISLPEAMESSRGLSKVRARLIINSVLPPHQGSITCLATSGSKTVAASTVLIVTQGKGGARASNLSSLFMALPLSQPRARIVLWSPVRMALQGSDVTLPCRAAGRPAPQVYWLDAQGDLVAQQDPRLKVLPDGELQMKNLAWRDMGAYTCIARNSFSKDSISTFVYPLLNEN